MKVLLTGATGGIGAAIKESLKEHDITCYRPDLDYVRFKEDFDWVILAHGVLDEDYEAKTFWANTTVPIWMTKDLLKQTGQGFIYISSTAGITGNSKYPVYSASKAALNIYAKSMQKAHPELQFYALCPGPTKTKLWDSLGLSGNPQEPVEVAKAVQRIIAGEFKGHVVITVRNGEVLCV